MALLPNSVKERFKEGLSPDIPHLSKGEIGDLRRDMYEALTTIAEENEEDQTRLIQTIGELQDLQSEHSFVYLVAESLGKAASGDALLILPEGLSKDVAASELNAAVAGEYKKYFSVRLETSKSLLHYWASFAPVLTGNKSAIPAIGVPTLNDMTLERGCGLVEVTFDTDAGSTKIYAPDDSVSVNVQVNAGDTLMGWPISMVTKTFNVT